jgi:hypothetical protein
MINLVDDMLKSTQPISTVKKCRRRCHASRLALALGCHLNKGQKTRAYAHTSALGHL